MSCSPIEVRFNLSLTEIEHSLLSDSLSEREEDIQTIAARIVGREIRNLLDERKADVGRILAMTGKIDEQVRIESAKLAEARKSPW